MSSAVQFCAWIAQASPGDQFVYHRGLLALDASEWSQSFMGHARRELNQVARRAWWAAGQSPSAGQSPGPTPEP